MTDYTVYQKVWRAKQRAIELLNLTGFSTSVLDGQIFHIEATRKHSQTIIKIHVSLGRPDKGLIDRIKKINLPQNCTKEVWCKYPNEQYFKIIALNGK